MFKQVLYRSPEYSTVTLSLLLGFFFFLIPFSFYKKSLECLSIFVHSPPVEISMSVLTTMQAIRPNADFPIAWLYKNINYEETSYQVRLNMEYDSVSRGKSMTSH